MVRITRSAQCGNSPKNVFLEALAVGLATRAIESVLAVVTDDIVWNVIGIGVARGRAEFAERLPDLYPQGATELVIHHVISHGRSGAANGTITYPDGARIEFCDIYQFGSAKGNSVRAITSYGLRAKA